MADDSYQDLYLTAESNPITVQGVTITFESSSGLVTVNPNVLLVQQGDDIEWVCPDADFAAMFNTVSPTDHPGWGAKKGVPSKAKVIVPPMQIVYKYTVWVYSDGQSPISIDPYVIVT